LAESTRAIKREVKDLRVIACNGTASLEELKYLKSCGVDSYNHNLESSRDYYREICSTHTWDERYRTCESVKEAGLDLCVGGIFGMGEREVDRELLLNAIVSLKPESVPLNFFIPNPALPLGDRNISYGEALQVIRRARELLGDRTLLMVARGARGAIQRKRERDV